MTDEVEVLVELLTDVLGEPHNHYESKAQISFDCPVCAAEKGLEGGDRKGNLEVNYIKHVYKCWACAETYGTHGPLGKLFDKFATKKQKKLYELVKPEELKLEDKKKVYLRLPEGYTKFKDSNPAFIPHKEAMNYLKSRGITDEMIEKYGIGFCDKGDHAGRIVVPSYNKKGELNYYIARSWNPMSKAKYKKIGRAHV